MATELALQPGKNETKESSSSICKTTNDQQAKTHTIWRTYLISGEQLKEIKARYLSVIVLAKSH